MFPSAAEEQPPPRRASSRTTSAHYHVKARLLPAHAEDDISVGRKLLAITSHELVASNAVVVELNNTNLTIALHICWTGLDVLDGEGQGAAPNTAV